MPRSIASGQALSLPNGSTFGASAGTVALVLRRTGGTGSAISIWNAGGWVPGFSSGNLLQLTIGATTRTFTGITVSNTTDWWLLIVNKASGTQTPRGHGYNYATDTWTHANGSGTLANPTAATSFNSASSQIEVAAVAWWARALSDSECEGLTGSWQHWLATNPDIMIILDQDDTADTIQNITGRSVLSAGTNTATIGGSVPVVNWGSPITSVTYGPSAPSGDATVDAAAATGSAQAYAPTLTTGANVSAASASASAQAYAPGVAVSTEVDAAVAGATTQAHAPDIITGAVVSAETAAASAQAYDPAVDTVTVINAEASAATTQAHTPTITTGAVISAAAATATAQAHAPTVDTVTAVSAEAGGASGQAHAPGITTGSTVAAALATATAQAAAPAPSVAVTVPVEVASASAQATTPAVATGLAIPAAVAFATAQSYIPAIEIPAEVSVVPATAAAQAYAVTISIGPAATVPGGSGPLPPGMSWRALTARGRAEATASPPSGWAQRQTPPPGVAGSSAEDTPPPGRTRRQQPPPGHSGTRR